MIYKFCNMFSDNENDVSKIELYQINDKVKEGKL